ncbi:alpha/beta hydrolase-fold protein [soil metagenome]
MAGAVGAAGVGLGLGAGLAAILDAGDPSPAGDDIAPGPIVRKSFVSADRGDVPTRWSLIRPPDVTGPLRVVLALHGMGGSTDDLLGPDWDLPGGLARAVAGAGVEPFAIATVSGGTSFWHARPWGEDAGAMVLEEFLPMLLSRPDVAPGKIGMLGWSMGGYGVLRLAGVLGPNKVAAVVASSPGLYTDPKLAHPEGFVDAAEYERFSIMDDQADLTGIPLRIDIGTEDPFYDATRAYVDGFPPDADLTAQYGEGGHELDFTQRVLPAQLAFLGEHLAD